MWYAKIHRDLKIRIVKEQTATIYSSPHLIVLASVTMSLSGSSEVNLAYQQA